MFLILEGGNAGEVASLLMVIPRSPQRVKTRFLIAVTMSILLRSPPISIVRILGSAVQSRLCVLLLGYG